MVSDVNLVWQKRTNTKQKSTFRMLYIPAACTSECYDLALPDLSLRLERQEHLSQFQDATELLPCHTALPVHLRIRDPRSRAAKKNTSHGNEVLSRDTTHLIPRPCYQRGSPCQDPAGSWTVWTPDHRKEKHTEAVSRSSGLAKTILQGTVKGGRRQHQGMDRPGVRQVPEKNEGNCLWSRLWRPNDPRGYWAGEGEEEVLKVRCSIKGKDGDGFYLPDFGVCLVLSLPFCLTPGFWLACR